MATSRNSVFRFDDFTIDIKAAELRRGTGAVPVEPQVFDLIRFLVENAGRVVSRDEIIEGVWGGRIVSDAAISTRINAARRALGDDGKRQHYIRTVQRRGFRFMGRPRAVQLEHSPPQSGAPAGGAERDALSLPDRPSIVVLPFRNLTGSTDHEYLADGLRIDIQNALIKVSGAFVIAAGSANAFRESSVQDAAHALGVRYALEGSVRSAGRRVRFSVQLTDAVTSRIVWSEQFDRPLADSFEVLDDISACVLTAMNVKLVAGEPARVWHKTLHDLKSLEMFYQGVSEFFKMNRVALTKARRKFEIIAERHPEASIGPTWVALTHWYDFQRGWTDSPERTKESARQWAERAVSQEDADGQAHTVLSHVYLLDRRFADALAAGEGAVANRPNCTHANGFYANVLHYCGDQQKALHHIGLAMRYSPIHPPLFKDILAAASLAAGDVEGAAAAASEAVAMNPKELVGRLYLASASVKRDRDDVAARLAEEIMQIDPAFSVAGFLGRQPYRIDDFPKSLAENLHAAGLPD